MCKSLACFFITNLKDKDYNNFYQVLLLSGEVSLNPGPLQISPAVNTNIWKPLNKKGLQILHINTTVYFQKLMNLNAFPIRLRPLLLK